MLSKKQQILLMELMLNKRLKGREIYKKGIFSNESDQSKQIRELKSFNYIDIAVSRKSKREAHYSLTKIGKIFTNILALQKNNERRYRKMAKEGSILWLP